MLAARATTAALAALVAATTLSACAGAPRRDTATARSASGAPAAERAGARSEGSPPSELPPFSETSASPSPEAADRELGFCGRADRALDRVALRAARPEAEQHGALDAGELAFAMRAEGEPHVWPHTLTLSGEALDDADVATHLHDFLDSFAEGGERRCGVARLAGGSGTRTVGVVVVDALADLSPLPTRARVGQWLRFEATLLVPASGAKLVVLGPSGVPHTVPTTLHGARVEATFALDRPGPFTVQLIAIPSGGPRPVLEAMVFADTTPARSIDDWPAPGELDAAANDPTALVRMVNAARAAESLPGLATSSALDRVAAAHARALEHLGRLAHDAGDGDPIDRVHRAGLSPARTGENVAHAATLRLAHRLLWASPSHRGNLLDGHFDTLGVGATVGADGSVWVCEIFADFSGTGTSHGE